MRLSLRRSCLVGSFPCFGFLSLAPRSPYNHHHHHPPHTDTTHFDVCDASLVLLNAVTWKEFKQAEHGGDVLNIHDHTVAVSNRKRAGERFAARSKESQLLFSARSLPRKPSWLQKKKRLHISPLVCAVLCDQPELVSTWKKNQLWYFTSSAWFTSPLEYRMWESVDITQDFCATPQPGPCALLYQNLLFGVFTGKRNGCTESVGHICLTGLFFEIEHCCPILNPFSLQAPLEQFVFCDTLIWFIHLYIYIYILSTCLCGD